MEFRWSILNQPVSDVTLRLHQTCGEGSESYLKYDSLVVTFGQRDSSGAEWTEPHHSGAVVQTVAEIAGQTSAVVVGVLEEPLFRISSVVSLSGAVMYKSSQSDGTAIQDVLSAEINLKVEDLIHGTLTPFSTQNTPDESDLVSVLVSSKCWKLRASPRHLMPPLLPAALDMVGLVQVAELGCWVGPSVSGGALSGILIIPSDTETPGGGYTFHVYTREMRQTLLLLRSLQAQWKVEVCTGSAAGVQDCIACMRAELCALRSIARPGVEYLPEEWEKIIHNLSSLELATDLSFESHVSAKPL